MAEDRPRQRVSDRHRIATAALFLCFLVATMLTTLNRHDLDTVGETAPPFTGEGTVPTSVEEDSSDTPPPEVGEGLDREPTEQIESTNGVAPVGAGVTHHVASAAQWSAAVAAAAPGDVIRLTATITSPLIYRGDNDGGVAEGADGTAQAPIVITADPGAWIDLGSVSTNNLAGLNLWYVDHVHAVGVQVRNAQYGIRCLQCHGEPGSPLRIAGNTVTQLGYVGIHVGGHLSTHAESSHVVIENNSVSNTGKLVAAYGEGIYLGHGAKEWIDGTSNITVRWNEVSHTTAEGIDIKPGTREIVVEENLIHHVAPIDGGSISAHYVHNASNPHPQQLDRVIVRNNRIWNQNLNGASGASDAAIWVGHGGVEILDNLVWGFRTHFNTRAVRVRSPQPFGPHPVRIENNTFWIERGWVADGWPAPGGSVNATGNRGPNGSSVEVVVGAGDFVGPVPPIGSGGMADSGSGPGSGLALLSQLAAQPSPPPDPTPPKPSPTTPPAPTPTAPAASPSAAPPPVPSGQPIATPAPGAAPAPSPGPVTPGGHPSDASSPASTPLPDPVGEPEPVTVPAEVGLPPSTTAEVGEPALSDATAPDMLAFGDLSQTTSVATTVGSLLGEQATGSVTGAAEPLGDASAQNPLGGPGPELASRAVPDTGVPGPTLDELIPGHRPPATGLGVMIVGGLALGVVALGLRSVQPEPR